MRSPAGGPAAAGAVAEKVIGVLGGMGPEATLAFYEKLVANTPARRDQDHLRVVIDSNPKVPDRSAALAAGAESPLPMMVAGLEALAAAGADFVVIPCVSAHGFLDELRRRAPVPVLSMLEVAGEHIRDAHPEIVTVGLLATTGTIAAGRFQRTLVAGGLRVVTPAPEDQERVMAAIYEIKASADPASRLASRTRLLGVAARLLGAGAEGIVLGCTEIPLVLTQAGVPVPVFDVVEILARAAITAAGRRPVDRHV